VHVTHITESLVGGPSTYLTLLVHHQLSLGWQVSIIADPSLLTEELSKSGATIRSYKSSRSPLKILAAAREVRRRLTELHPDVTHLHGTFAGLYGRILGSLKMPTVYCPHGWAFVRTVSLPSKACSALIERALSSFTDATINVSEFERKSAHNWGIRKNQIVILNSVREAGPSPQKLFEPKPDVINLGFLGRLDYQKGFDLILEAINREVGQSVHLWVAGAAYRGDSASWQQAANVTFLGWLSGEQVDRFMNAVDAVVMPSRWEGCPLAALEAMRSGKALLSSDRCGLPELIIHGYNGILYSIDIPNELDAAIASCTRESLQAMGSRAREVFYSTFHPADMLSALDRLYLSLTGSPQKTREFARLLPS
jgi:glycosyltransferase involved in cell wall biosynthesis